MGTMSYLCRLFQRSGDADRVGASFWEKLAADVLGPLMEILWRMFAVLLLGAAIVPLLRERPWSDPVSRLLALGAGLAILALLTSRIVRTTYQTISGRTYRVRLVICPVAASFFVVDAVWLAFGGRWLYSSTHAVAAVGVAPDPAFELGGPAIVLSVSAGLLALRLWSRIRVEGAR